MSLHPSELLRYVDSGLAYNILHLNPTGVSEVLKDLVEYIELETFDEMEKGFQDRLEEEGNMQFARGRKEGHCEGYQEGFLDCYHGKENIYD